MAPPRLTLVSASQKSSDDKSAGSEEASAAADARAGAEAEQPAIAASRPAAKSFSTEDRNERMRILEALLFAASEPLDEGKLASHLPGGGAETGELLEELKGFYRGRGINLVRVAGKWAFRTSEDLSYLLERHATEERRLSKAALETLAIIGYHQPVTRAEIEEIRGVTTSAGTLDILLETRWVRPRGRRRAPGKPLTYGTTEAFLAHFGLDSIKDLPGLAELKGAGLLDGNLPPGFTVPAPTDVAALMPDELPLEADDEEPGQSEMALDLPEDEGTDKDDGERDAPGGAPPEVD